MSMGIRLLRSRYPVATTNFQNQEQKLAKKSKRKSLVVSIRKLMSESFELIPKPEHLSTRLQS
jgi:hypothetical protein